VSPEDRLSMASKMKLETKPKPVRRVYIDKPGSDEKRPLGIPTMTDRAVQARLKMVRH